MTITIHTLVKNEERFIYFAITSIINYVDKILLWDTGSNDNTVPIIKEILKTSVGKEKIDFRQVGEVDEYKFTDIRQKMLDNTETDWFFILDGDEVWWEDSIKNLTKTIQSGGMDLDFIISPYYNIVGDIYHYQEEAAGMYQIGEKSGHINIRAINKKIPGLHFEKPHGLQGLADGNGVLIQDRVPAKSAFLNYKYMHFSNVIRSSSRANDLKVPKRNIKLKYDLGIPFPKSFKYPEVFYKKYPLPVPDPWQKRSVSFTARAMIETPLRRIKRRLFRSTVGY